MKAFALEGPDKPAGVIDLPKPDVGAHGFLVAVRAASVNGFDVFQASGYLLGMMAHDLPTVIGRDFAGVVETVGSEFDDLSVGDEVFGFIPAVPPLSAGTFAEYVAGGPEIVFARKPAGLDSVAAAALPLAGSAALDLLDAIDRREGDVVLIVGATGGVGSLAIQLAVRAGLTVVATARPEEDAFVRRLGAAETLDYSASNVAEAVRRHHPDGVAALVDLVDQKDALAALASVVRPGGHVATLLGAADVDMLAKQGLVGHNVAARPTADKLRTLGELASSGALRVPIQASYPLDRASEALALFQQGTLGKLVITV